MDVVSWIWHFQHRGVRISEVRINEGLLYYPMAPEIPKYTSESCCTNLLTMTVLLPLLENLG